MDAAWNATGWPGGSLRSLLQGTAWMLPGMPPAGPVDRYVPCYRGQHGSCLECHRLARWIVTFLATGDSMDAAWNATGQAGGINSDCVYRYLARSVTIPRASRGHFKHGNPPTAMQLSVAASTVTRQPLSDQLSRVARNFRSGSVRRIFWIADAGRETRTCLSPRAVPPTPHRPRPAAG